MPFDPFDQFRQDEPELLSYPLNRARLYKLSAALRREMPDDFMWEFDFVLRQKETSSGRCTSAGCALGLARVMFPDFDREFDRLSFHELIEMPDDAIEAVFFDCGPRHEPADITAAIVADRLDAYLEKSHAVR